jgi:EmrB/QacA subfamily drug resistance transporter
MSRQWQVLSLVSVAVFMSSLDLFIVNVALPDIQAGFGSASLGNVSWVLSAYAIVFAALLVPSGRLADRVGRKRFFQFGLLLFTLASALCAAAPTLGMLVNGRILQAVGAACLFPTSLALLLPEFNLKDRPTAIAIYSSVGGVSAALGPPIGGLLVGASWRLIFLVNVPVGVITLVLGWFILRATREEGKTAIPDILGALVLTGAIASLVGAIVQGGDWGWSSPATVGSFSASLLLTAVFFWRTGHHTTPIIDLSMLRVRTFAMANVAQLLFSAAFGGMLLSLVLFLTGPWQYSILRAGLAIAPGPAMAAITSIPGGKLGQRIGQAKVLMLSTTVFAIAFLLWAWQVSYSRDYLTAFLPALILSGIGVGPTIPNVVAAGVATLNPARYATGSAVLSMSRQIGAALGVAIFVAVMGTAGADEMLSGLRRGWVVGAGLSIAAGVVCLLFSIAAGKGKVERTA